MTDDQWLLLGTATVVFACLFGACVGTQSSPELPAPAPSAPIARRWTPCEPPRPGVECWCSGHAVVCLPLTPEDEP